MTNTPSRRFALILSTALALACATSLALAACAHADIGGAKTHKSAAGHISGGARFSCAVTGGDVRCWGIGGYGALGQANTDDIGDDETPASVPPIDFGPGVKIKSISSGFYHVCAISTTGQLYCWGLGANGALGYGSHDPVGATNTPADVGPVDLNGHKVKSMATGGRHTCVIIDGGKVRCWGLGNSGQLGYGSKKSTDDASKAKDVNLGKGRTAKAIAAGGYQTCVILDNGKVRCWGSGHYGQTGHGNNHDTTHPAKTPYIALGNHKAVGITAGYLHTCALLDNGSVRCWGRGISGQLGYGSRQNYGDKQQVSMAPPLRLGKNQKAVAISAFGQHTCAILKKGGKVECWGTGKYGQLGYGNTNSIGDNEYPGSAGAVKLGGKAVAIQTGGRHTCAVYDGGKVRCWGLNSDGQLGYGNTDSIGDDETPDKAGPVELGGKVSG